MTIQEMSCHTWALSGNTQSGIGEAVNNDYISLTNTIGERYDYGQDLQGSTLAQIRQNTMNELLGICEARTRQTDNTVYLCGGFREGQVCPEHMWIEDHTANRTYDTFINQPIIVVNRVGVPEQPFQPGCEADAFLGNEIFRVQLNGYTAGQYDSLPA